ncbi:MAG: DMT family transporter [Candidatus Omnitrophica bacterium]|nr:DMT family transporter [Candidatus Omnitrophota bacterium]
MNQQVFGGILALLSAASWALGTILWRKIGNKISPLSMNLSKGIIGLIFLGAMLLLTGIEPVNFKTFSILALSGLLGIAIGDTLFFMSLMRLGPRLTSLMGALTPVLIALSAVFLLGERPSFLGWIGIFLTVIGVIRVLRERVPQKEIITDKSLGIKYGLLSILAMTAGVIFAKIGVEKSPALEATFIRVLGAVTGLALWGRKGRKLKEWLLPFKDFHLLKRVSFVVIIGTFGGFWLFLLALKRIDASVAGALGSTTPLFILPMTAIMLREKISLRAGMGAAIAVCGVALIFFG